MTCNKYAIQLSGKCIAFDNFGKSIDREPKCYIFVWFAFHLVLHCSPKMGRIDIPNQVDSSELYLDFKRRNIFDFFESNLKHLDCLQCEVIRLRMVSISSKHPEKVSGSKKTGIKSVVQLIEMKNCGGNQAENQQSTSILWN